MNRLITTITAVFLSGGAALAAPVGGTGNVVPDVIFGSGNANGSFTGVRNNSLELALRGKLRYNTSGLPENTFNYDGVDTYTFAVGDGVAPVDRSVFNFEWSINSDVDGNGGALSLYDYAIGVDTDPSSAVSAIAYDPISPISTGAYFGTNSFPNGGASFTANSNPAATFDFLAAANNVAQNSVNLGFLSLFPDPQLEGIFTISLSAFDAGTGNLVASTSINIQYGDAPAVPLPAGAWLLISGIFGFGLVKRRKRSAA